MWQDILKTQESITSNKVGIFKPKQGFELDNDNNEKCCEDARLQMIKVEKEWHLSFRYEDGEGPDPYQLLELAPWNDLIDIDCEYLYDYLEQQTNHPFLSIEYQNLRSSLVEVKKEWDECKA